MEISAQALGLSQEAISERVAHHISKLMLHGYDLDSDDGKTGKASKFTHQLNERIKEQIDISITDIAGRHVLPHITEHIETVIFQQTTEWGEKKGEPISFTEYLISRADKYMLEKVDYTGKTKDEARGMSWRSTQTRITYLIDQHLHYSIENAMKIALESANSSIAKGIEEAVKIKLKEVQEKLSITVTSKR